MTRPTATLGGPVAARLQATLYYNRKHRRERNAVVPGPTGDPIGDEVFGSQFLIQREGPANSLGNVGAVAPIPGTNNFIAVWRDSVDSKARAAVLTVNTSTNAITQGTAIAASTNNAGSPSVRVVVVSATKAIMIFVDSTTSFLVAQELNISGTTVSLGTAVNVSNGGLFAWTHGFFPTVSRVAIVYGANATGNLLGRTLDYSSMTLGTEVELNADHIGEGTNLVTNGTATAMLIHKNSASHPTAPDIGFITGLTVSATTITAGTPVQINANSLGSSADNVHGAWDSVNSKWLACYTRPTVGVYARPLDIAVSDRTVTLGTEFAISASATTQEIRSFFDPSTEDFVIVTRPSAGGNLQAKHLRLVSGALSFIGTSTVFTPIAPATGTSVLGAEYSSDAERTVIMFNQFGGGASLNVRAIVMDD